MKNSRALTLAMFVLAPLCLQAQVTIGSNTPPNLGALLDLKENGEIIINSSKGLCLPRVKLISKTALYPMFTTLEDTLNTDYKVSHTGLTVYHISDNPRPECDTLPSGVYVWNGTTWDYFLKKKKEFISLENYNSSTGILTDRSGFTYKTAHFGSAGRWMVENIRTVDPPTCDYIYVYNGEPSLTKRQYHYPSGNISGGDIAHKPDTWTEPQGMLYNWAAATNLENTNTGNQSQQVSSSIGTNEIESIYERSPGAKDGRVQGICPQGWHLPSDREWNALEQEIANRPTLYSTSTSLNPWETLWEIINGFRGNHGIAMMSTTNLLPQYSGGTSKSASQGGFDALLVGSMEQSSAYGYGIYAYFWSSSYSETNQGKLGAMHRYIISPDGSGTNPGTHRVALNGTYLISVRCKQD